MLQKRSHKSSTRLLSLWLTQIHQPCKHIPSQLSHSFNPNDWGQKSLSWSQMFQNWTNEWTELKYTDLWICSTDPGQRFLNVEVVHAHSTMYIFQKLFISDYSDSAGWCWNIILFQHDFNNCMMTFWYWL